MYSNTEGTTYSAARTSTAQSSSVFFFRLLTDPMIYGLRDRMQGAWLCFPGCESRPKKPKSTCQQTTEYSFHYLTWVRTTPATLSRLKYRLFAHNSKLSWNRSWINVASSPFRRWRVHVSREATWTAFCSSAVQPNLPFCAPS